MPESKKKSPEELLKRLGWRLQKGVAATRPLGEEQLAKIRGALRQGIEETQTQRDEQARQAQHPSSAKTKTQQQTKAKDSGKDQGQSHGH